MLTIDNFNEEIGKVEKLLPDDERAVYEKLLEFVQQFGHTQKSKVADESLVLLSKWLDSIPKQEQIDPKKQEIIDLFIDQRVNDNKLITNRIIMKKAFELGIRVSEIREILKELQKAGKVPTDWKRKANGVQPGIRRGKYKGKQ